MGSSSTGRKRKSRLRIINEMGMSKTAHRAFMKQSMNSNQRVSKGKRRRKNAGHRKSFP